MSLPESAPFVRNLGEARFECIFGRGCDGICCREGEPPVYPDDIERIDANLAKFLPEMRSEAQAALHASGYLGDGQKAGQRVLRVIDGWCIFFHRGCVFHRVGAAEGDRFRYKPSICAVFPLDKDEHGWTVRQKDYNGEVWDLFCLDPAQTSVRAEDSLRDEIALARTFEVEASGDVVPTNDG